MQKWPQTKAENRKSRVKFFNIFHAGPSILIPGQVVAEWFRACSSEALDSEFKPNSVYKCGFFIPMSRGLQIGRRSPNSWIWEWGGANKKVICFALMSNEMDQNLQNDNRIWLRKQFSRLCKFLFEVICAFWKMECICTLQCSGIRRYL